MDQPVTDTASGVIAPPQRHLQRFTRVSTLIFVSLPCLLSGRLLPHVMVPLTSTAEGVGLSVVCFELGRQRLLGGRPRRQER